MAQVTDAGIQPTSTDAYMLAFANAIRIATGADTSFEASTPQAQLARQWSLTASSTDASIIDIYNSVALDTASGIHLERLVALLGFSRRQAQRSTATVTFTGASGTVVPAGRRLRSTNGDFFTTLAPLTLSGTTGAVAVAATETGAVNVDAGVITALVSSIAGITALTNAAGVVGRDVEADAQLRNRYLTTLAFNALGPLVAVQSAVRAVTGVTYAVANDNPTASAVTTQGVSIPAHALVVVVSGGSDAAVASAISQSKPAGIPTSGATTQNVTRITGDSETIRFERVAAVPITAAVEYTPTARTQGDLGLRMTQILVDYVGALQPGETLDQPRARARLLDLPNFPSASLTLTFALRAGGSALPATVNLNQQLTLSSDDVTITAA